MKKTLTTTAILAITAIAFVSCEKEKEKENPIVTPDSGLIVLNEGGWGMNNASITYYDFETGSVSQDVFFNQNGRLLGDLANDILIYGGKIYISVGGSSTVEITDLELNSIKQISFDGTSVEALEPQGLAAYNGKVYIASFDGKVARLDTATLQIEQLVQVGKNPVSIAISNGFLYVSNSGGLDFPIFDSTVSVVNLATFTEVQKIVVGTNPATLGVDENGHIIVGCRGNHMDISSSLHRINTATNAVDRTFANIFPADFVMKKSFAYIYNHDWMTGENQFIEFNTSTESITNSNFIADPSLIQSPYGIAVNSQSEDIYISDAGDYASPGKVVAFDKNGAERFEFETGIAPKRIVVLR